jgi:hypothetical protein
MIFVARRAPQGPLAPRSEPPSAQLRANAPSVPAGPAIGAQRTAAPESGPGVVDELCGVNSTDRMRAGNETLDQHVERVTQRAIRRWKNALAASEDPRRQAIGLALTNTKPELHVPTPEELTAGSEASKDTSINNNLVLLATETNDPAIYSLAIGQCRRDTNDMASGPCQGLSWEHWANIDTDNGMPWLWMAVKANRAGDKQRVEEALAKASTASRLEAYGSAVTELALGALPGDSAPLEEAVAGADVISILRVGTPVELISLCSATAIEETLRKQECSAIATTLAKQGTTFVDVRVAGILADRLGFSQETRTALWTEGNNAQAALMSNPRLLVDGSGLRCNTVLAYDRFIDALRMGNERAALLAVAAANRETERR